VLLEAGAAVAQRESTRLKTGWSGVRSPAAAPLRRCCGLKAVILAGGFGKRLRPYTSEKPKPLVEVAGKPILVWQIEWLKKYGFNEVVLLVGYLKEKIIEYIGSGSHFIR
jgi:hypothetical protein